MTDGKNAFDQPAKNDLITHEKVRKIATGQRNDYITGCLLDHNYFDNYYSMVAIDLSKQQALDADPKVIQQIHFTPNQDLEGQTAMYFIIKEAKETVLHFS